MHLTVDLESRSRVDLKTRGMHIYAADESTDIMCFAFKVDSETPGIWIPANSPYDLYTSGEAPFQLLSDWEIVELIDKADIIEAHNLGFESVMWKNIMEKKYGFPALPKHKLRCSAALASYYALPRSLAHAAEALDLEQKKDTIGYKIMMKLCKPKRDGTWHEDRDDFIKLCEYCIQDVVTEYVLSQSLYPLPKKELAVWRMDQDINSRGIYVDLKAVANLTGKIKEEETELLLDCQRLTGGVVNSVRQVGTTLKWLKLKGVDLPNLQKATVQEALDMDMPKEARRILDIRTQLAKSSVSKFKAMENMAGEDSRIRGMFLYHGASTGRFSGKGVQTHNLPRDTYGDEDIEGILNSDRDDIYNFYGDLMPVASKCIRGMLCSSPGNLLVAGDWKAIEARVLAWIAGEEGALKAYRQGKDIYKVNAARTYGVPYEAVTKDQRQVGKTQELALGFQGWVGAFKMMASSYGVDMTEEEMTKVIIEWRNSRPNTVAYWKAIEATAIKAVKNKGQAYSYGMVKFGVRGRFLHCRLPSGKLISYCDPDLESKKDKYDRLKLNITYKSMDSMTHKWKKTFTYGGKLTENIVQATSRDLLVEAMLRTEAANFPTVLHCHDEIVAEVPEDNTRYEEFINLMKQNPDWAEGLPLDVDGWQGKRYRK